MIQIDVAKAGAQLFNLSKTFNARVYDGFTPLFVQWVDSTNSNQPIQTLGKQAFLEGQLGKGKITDTGVEMEPASKQISWQDDGSQSRPNGITEIKLPPQVFTRDGIFYGNLGLKDDNGTVMSSVNVWFNVAKNNLTAGANGSYYFSAINDALSQVGNATQNMHLLEHKVQDQVDLVSIAYSPQTFATIDDLKKKYPNGASGVYVVAADGHKYIWTNGAWKDCGVYQSTGIASESINADKTTFLPSMDTSQITWSRGSVAYFNNKPIATVYGAKNRLISGPLQLPKGTSVQVGSNGYKFVVHTIGSDKSFIDKNEMIDSGSTNWQSVPANDAETRIVIAKQDGSDFSDTDMTAAAKQVKVVLGINYEEADVGFLYLGNSELPTFDTKSLTLTIPQGDWRKSGIIYKGHLYDFQGSDNSSHILQFAKHAFALFVFNRKDKSLRACQSSELRSDDVIFGYARTGGHTRVSLFGSPVVIDGYLNGKRVGYEHVTAINSNLPVIVDEHNFTMTFPAGAGAAFYADHKTYVLPVKGFTIKLPTAEEAGHHTGLILWYNTDDGTFYWGSTTELSKYESNNWLLVGHVRIAWSDVGKICYFYGDFPFNWVTTDGLVNGIWPSSLYSQQSKLIQVNHHTGSPNNTLAGIKKVRARGVLATEMDLQITKDGIFVLSHDETINRMCRNSDGSAIAGTVSIPQHTYDELQAYDAGIGEGVPGEKIPKLESALALCKILGMETIYLDHIYNLTEAQALAVVAMVKKLGLSHQVIYEVDTKGWNALRIRNVDPQARLLWGMWTVDDLDKTIDYVKPYAIDGKETWISINQNALTPEVAAKVTDAGIHLGSFQNDSADQAKLIELVSMGVSSVETDDKNFTLDLAK